MTTKATTKSTTTGGGPSGGKKPFEVVEGESANHLSENAVNSCVTTKSNHQQTLDTPEKNEKKEKRDHWRLVERVLKGKESRQLETERGLEQS